MGLLADIQSEIVFQQAEKAGQLAQHLFYLFIEHAWAYDMESIHVVQNFEGIIDEVVVIAGKGVETGPGGASSLPRTGGNWLIKFPHEAFNLEDEDAKLALMADGNSQWAFVFMHMAIRRLFGHLVNNVDEDILEVTHYAVEGGARHIIVHKGLCRCCDIQRPDQVYNDDDGHGIYEITLKSGEKTALDLSGAQYNLPYKPVMRWSDYWVPHGHMRSRSPFRTHYENHVKLLRSLKLVSVQTLLMDLITHFSIILEEAGLDDTTVPQLWHLPLETNARMFRKQSSALLFHVHNKMQARVKQYDTENALKGFPFGLRHPSLFCGEMSVPHLGDVRSFCWKTLKDVCASTETSYHTKKLAKDMLGYQFLFRTGDEDGGWRLKFVKGNVPWTVPAKWVSCNPYWKEK